MVPAVIEKLFDFLQQQRQIFQEYKLTGNERRCTLTLKFCHEDYLNSSAETVSAITPSICPIEDLTGKELSLTVDVPEITDADQESDSGLQMSPNPIRRIPKYMGSNNDNEVHSSESENGTTGAVFNFTSVAPFTLEKEAVSEDTDASDNTDCDSDARSEDSFDVVSVVDPDEPSDEKLADEAIHELETSKTCHSLYLKTQVSGLTPKARENIMDQTRNSKILKRAYHFDGAMNTLIGISEDVIIRLNIDSREDSALGTMRKWALRDTANKSGWQDWFEGEFKESRYTVPADDDRYPTASRKMEHILMNIMSKLREELR